MYKLELSGFNSKEEAEAFLIWYSGGGEQDAMVWFEDMKQEGEIKTDFMGTEGTSKWEDNTLIQKLKMNYEE